MSYIILFETSSFFLLLQRVISLILFFLILLHAGPKVPHLTFPDRSVDVFFFFFFFSGGSSFFDRKYEEGGARWPRVPSFSFFFSFHWNREKKEKMISLSNVTSDWTRKDGLGVIQHSTVPSPTSKRSADGSG
jgi:hypothetical protein